MSNLAATRQMRGSRRDWRLPMGLKKQEFYEGAALHQLARTGKIASMRYEPPFFYLNGCVLILLKYSTKGRSPWGFTFTPDEQLLLHEKAPTFKTKIGLICGHDGVAAIGYDSYLTVASQRTSSVHISCYRPHGAHYEISGPDGILKRKIAPSNWQRILLDEVSNEAL